MKIGRNKLKMSSGEIRTFKSQAARDRFERVARAIRHGWKPPSKKKGHHSTTPIHDKFSNYEQY